MNEQTLTVEKMLESIRSATIGTDYENKLFIVGGFVRDKLLNLPLPSDIDIVLEDDALALAQFLFQKGICEHKPVVYPRFGTAMTHIGGHVLELVTARSESYDAASRKPIQVHRATIEEDARRRDFTINTLLENLHTGEIIDPLGFGITDLNNKLIRTPLDPVATFYDDPLRMLRAIRFAVRLNFEIDSNCYSAIVSESQRLKVISLERVRDELIKMMPYPNCVTGLKLMADSGLLEIFAPELKALIGVSQNDYHLYDVWDHTLSAINHLNPNAEILTKIALLFHDIGKLAVRTVDESGRVRFLGHEQISAEMTYEILQRLKFPNNEIDRIVKLVRLHMHAGAYEPTWTDTSVKRLMRTAGDELDELLLLCRADALARKVEMGVPDFDHLDERIKRIREQMDITAVDSPLNGKEIMDYLNIEPCEQVGKIKDALIDAVIEGRLEPNDKTGSYKMLDELLDFSSE